MEELMSLLVEEPKLGTPPPLLAMWGGKVEPVVLEEVNFEESFFNQKREPIRARVSITLLGIQGLRESVTVRVVDPEEVDEFNPIGNF
jgi:hypothetical protein